MHPNPSNVRGKWLAAGLVVVGLVAALAGLKYRVLPQPPQEQPAATSRSI